VGKKSKSQFIEESIRIYRIYRTYGTGFC